MIRSLLIFIFLILFALFSLIALPVEWIIGKINKEAKEKSSLAIVRGTFRVILFLSGVKTTVIGKEHIPTDEPVLFVGNHRGFFDVIIGYTFMKRATGFVAKKEMEKVPGLRIWMRNLHCLFLDRQNMKEGLKTILLGIDYIKDGRSIFIFPEGTRNKGDGVMDFHAGSFKFAEKTGCKIIPVAQNNTNAIFEDHFPWVHATKTVIEFGTPIDLASIPKEERKKVSAMAQAQIAAMYEKNKALCIK